METWQEFTKKDYDELDMGQKSFARSRHSLTIRNSGENKVKMYIGISFATMFLYEADGQQAIHNFKTAQNLCDD